MKTLTSRHVVVTTTVDSKARAEKLAAAIVHSRLAACVQYTPVRSIYRWKGKVESASEQLLLAKTTASTASRLVEYIRKNHWYELPEITVQPIAGGLAGYLRWIEDETAAGGDGKKARPTCGCEHD